MFGMFVCHIYMLRTFVFCTSVFRTLVFFVFTSYLCMLYFILMSLECVCLLCMLRQDHTFVFQPSLKSSPLLLHALPPPSPYCLPPAPCLYKRVTVLTIVDVDACKFDKLKHQPPQTNSDCGTSPDTSRFNILSSQVWPEQHRPTSPNIKLITVFRKQGSH